MASAWSTETVTAVNYLSDAEDLTRFNNKSLGTNERNQTYKRWWKEQVRLYGTSVSYYVRKFDLSKTDKVYGENPYQGYQLPQTLTMLVDLTDGAITYSQYGLVSDDELAAVIDIETYQKTLSSYYHTAGYSGTLSAMPNAGDVFQLTEYGDDRPGGKDGKIFEITERMDQMVGEINQLQGHYVFKLRARRNDHTFLPGLPAEAKSTQVTDTSGVGPLTALETDYINDLDTEQASYFSEYGTNDDVYGDYY
jgi:hypothetical protein